MAYDVSMHFTQLTGIEGGAIRVVVTDTSTWREVANKTYIHRPLVTEENLKEEMLYAIHQLCGFKEYKKLGRKKSEPKEEDVATTVVKKEVKKNG